MKRKNTDTINTGEKALEEVSIRRKITFDSDDSDSEITFDKQAHKRRKMSQEIVDLKIWMETKFKETNDCAARIEATIAANSSRGIKNAEDIVDIRAAISRIEGRLPDSPASTSYARVATS